MRDFLQAIYPDDGPKYLTAYEDRNLFNCVPRLTDGAGLGVHPRHEVEVDSNAASASTDRGRGVFSLTDDAGLYIDESTYYYNGGSQDLTATTGNGYAGNTGFNEEFTASIVYHSVSNVRNAVIVNAGHASTHASANHGNVWYVADNTTAPSSVSSGNIPCNNGVSITRGGASLNGYFFVCDVYGNIYNSALNDITTWAALDFLKAQKEPDIAVYIGKHHDNICYIGTRSVEFFYDAGNPTGSPLSPRQDVSYTIGCLYPNTVVQIGDTIYFVGTDDSGWMGVYMLSNFQLSRISSQKLDEQIREAGRQNPDITNLDSMYHSFWMSYYPLEDAPGLILTLNSEWTFYYHMPSQKWMRWTFNADVTYHGGITSGDWTTVFPIAASNLQSQDPGSNSALVQFINGTVARATQNVGNTAISDLATSNNPDVFIGFPLWDGGTDRKKRINWVRPVTVPVADDATTRDPTDITIRWRDQDRKATSTLLANYNAGRTVDINTRGARVFRLGSTRARRFLVEWTSGYGPQSVLIGLEIDYDEVE